MNYIATTFLRGAGWIALSTVLVQAAWLGARELIRRNKWPESTADHLSLPFLDQWRKLPSIARYLAGLCVFTGFYYLAFAGGRAFTWPLSAPIWFPDTLLLFALLLTPVRKWWMFLLAILAVRL